MKEDVKLVKEIGDIIGYGHLMNIASSLWREMLREKEFPVSGAFLPTCLLFVKDKDKKMHEDDAVHYDNYVK